MTVVPIVATIAAKLGVHRDAVEAASLGVCPDELPERATDLATVYANLDRLSSVERAWIERGFFWWVRGESSETPRSARGGAS
jgi:hypothetical protein